MDDCFHFHIMENVCFADYFDISFVYDIRRCFDFLTPVTAHRTCRYVKLDSSGATICKTMVYRIWIDACCAELDALIAMDFQFH